MRIFLILILVFKTLSVAATPNDDKQSPEYWQTKISQTPENALYHFNLGVIYQKNNELNKAIAEYNKVVELKSKLAPVALYYKARAYESSGQLVQAKETIAVVNMNGVPENIKVAILTYKNKLFSAGYKTSVEASELEDKDVSGSTQKAEEEKRLSLYFDVTAGSNSNPQSLAPTSTTAIVSETQTQLRAGVDYLLSYSSVHDIKANYYYSGTNYSKSTTSNYFYHDITLPVAFYFDSFRLKLTPEFFTDTYNGSAYSDQKGGSADLSYKTKDNYINLLAQANDIKNKDTTYSYLSGTQKKFLLGYEQRWAISKMNYKIYSSEYQYQDTSTLGSSYQSLGFGLTYSLYYDSVDLALGGIYETRSYVKATSDTKAHKDQRFYLSSQIGYSFSTYFRIYLDASATINNSNFDTSTNDKTYNQNLILAGLSFNY